MGNVLVPVYDATAGTAGFVETGGFVKVDVCVVVGSTEAVNADVLDISISLELGVSETAVGSGAAKISVTALVISPPIVGNGSTIELTAVVGSCSTTELTAVAGSCSTTELTAFVGSCPTTEPTTPAPAPTAAAAAGSESTIPTTAPTTSTAPTAIPRSTAGTTALFGGGATETTASFGGPSTTAALPEIPPTNPTSMCRR